MTTTQQTHASTAAADEFFNEATPHAALTTGAREMLAQLRAAGRRGAAVTASGDALVTYWRFVREATLAERRRLVEALRGEGTATARAWLPIALGEPDFELARAATAHYLGGWPTTVDRRERAVADVTDWIVRALSLNRPALLFALLEQADADELERWADLCGRLTDAEASIVVTACAAAGRVPLAELAAQWRARLDAPVSSRPSREPRPA